MTHINNIFIAFVVLIFCLSVQIFAQIVDSTAQGSIVPQFINPANSYFAPARAPYSPYSDFFSNQRDLNYYNFVQNYLKR